MAREFWASGMAIRVNRRIAPARSSIPPLAWATVDRAPIDGPAGGGRAGARSRPGIRGRCLPALFRQQFEAPRHMGRRERHDQGHEPRFLDLRNRPSAAGR